MAFLTASISQAGGRTVNEDNCGFLEVGSAGCWVVADGLGGHGGGATASRLAVDAVLSCFRANPIVSADALRGYLATAQAVILRQQGEPGLSQMRSTIVVLLANEQTAVCGHIGDSRLYHFRSGAVAFQTVDHSVPGSLAAAGSISLDQIRFHEDRNRVLRSLGNDTELNPVIVERALSPGDMFLLCTDGFWEYVTEFEMEADWVKASTPADWLHFMGSRLLSRAKPDHDNYTAIAVVVRSASAPLPPPRPRSGSSAQPTSMSASEKVAWVLIACLSLTLLIFLAVSLFPDPLAATISKRHFFSGASPRSGRKAATEPKHQVTYGKFDVGLTDDNIDAELSFEIAPPLGHAGCVVIAFTRQDGNYVEEGKGRKFQLAQDFKGGETVVTLHFKGALPDNATDPARAQAILFGNPCSTEGDPVLSKSALVPLIVAQ